MITSQTDSLLSHHTQSSPASSLATTPGCSTVSSAAVSLFLEKLNSTMAQWTQCVQGGRQNHFWVTVLCSVSLLFVFPELGRAAEKLGTAQQRSVAGCCWPLAGSGTALLNNCQGPLHYLLCLYFASLHMVILTQIFFVDTNIFLDTNIFCSHKYLLTQLFLRLKYFLDTIFIGHRYIFTKILNIF